jgi:hypothetical protein
VKQTVLYQVLNAGEDVVEDDGFLDAGIQVLAELADLVGGGSTNLGLAVFKQALKNEKYKFTFINEVKTELTINSE